MSFEQVMAELTRGIPDCLASGIVDVRTGTVVACKSAERSFRQEFELIAASASAVFGAAPSEAMAGAAGKCESDSTCCEFKEVTLMGNGQLQVYSRTDSNPDLALIVICRSSANLGMVLAKTRLQSTALQW